VTAERERVIVVTGAARGLGRAIAEGLLAADTRIVAVCRPRPGTERLDFPSGSDRVLPVACDITDERDCARVIEAAFDRFGSVDALVNNAALSHESFPDHHATEFGAVSAERWRRVFEVNVCGTFLMTRAAVPAMLERGWGRIINISTSRASMLAPGVLPYGPSKAALEAMTVGWSQLLSGSGVTVNEVLPGGPAGPRSAEKHWWPEGVTTWPAEIMVPPIRWLTSRCSDGVTGRRFIARLWECSRPDAEAAAAAGSPAGWPLGPHDVAVWPPR
jgi:NAD(P)-dependent dehydrogenase (short-subunit alcohol dehydrogenase family)